MITLPVLVKKQNEQVSITPLTETVTLVGDPGILEPMNAFEVDVDVSNLKIDCTINVALVPPEGLSFVKDTDSEIRFLVKFTNDTSTNE